MKTLWRIREAGAKRIALQFPEGLLMYSCIICDILQDFGSAEDTFILGDVTYGACCVDDFTAVAMGADFLVHYGHSCLVPVTTTKIPCMYVFVDIQFDLKHFVETFELNFKPQEKVALAGTIQFATSLQARSQWLNAITTAQQAGRCHQNSRTGHIQTRVPEVEQRWEQLACADARCTAGCKAAVAGERLWQYPDSASSPTLWRGDAGLYSANATG
jgi:diphthamide biosynthesis enzyme Dph1/Dph2-like protein